jgi:hypothetical protein
MLLPDIAETIVDVLFAGCRECGIVTSPSGGVPSHWVVRDHPIDEGGLMRGEVSQMVPTPLFVERAGFRKQELGNLERAWEERGRGRITVNRKTILRSRVLHVSLAYPRYTNARIH